MELVRLTVYVRLDEVDRLICVRLTPDGIYQKSIEFTLNSPSGPKQLIHYPWGEHIAWFRLKSAGFAPLETVEQDPYSTDQFTQLGATKCCFCSKHLVPIQNGAHNYEL